MNMFKTLASDAGIKSAATDLGKEAAAKYKAAESDGFKAVIGDEKIKADATQLGKDAYAKVKGDGGEEKKSEE